jgi:DNA-binding transcriptional MocR family regulator
VAQARAKAPADDKGFLYEKIAATLAQQIQTGNLRPGDRCPSVRQVCKQFEVSLSTAVQALALLEARGLIEARPQSGFYIKARLERGFVLDSAPKARVAVGHVETSELINEVVAAARGAGAVPLGAATVGTDLLPGAALYKGMLQAARDLGPEGHMYEMPPGNEDLRRQIARRAMVYGCEVTASDVVITTGSMEAINLCMRAVTRPGDTVAIESPMFYGILEMLAAMGLKTAEIPAHPVTGIDLACLAQTLRSRRIAACLVVSNFSNPMGCKMPDEAKKELVELLDGAGVPLIEDDIYGDLQHDGRRPLAAKAYDGSGNVLLCSSFSKTLSPGLRVGWVLPGRYYRQIERLKFVSTIATATIPQAAVAHFLERGGYDRHLRRLRAALCTRLHQYSDAVQRHFPAGTRISQPQGGFVLWVQMPPEVDALRLYERARERGISIIPGPAFSADPDRYKSCIRLSCGGAYNRIMDNALKTLGAEARALAAGAP